jgi:hypothetical protein
VTGSGEAESLSGVPCALLLTIEGDGRIEWNTGQVSRFDFLLNSNPLNGTLAFGATITSGPLDGDTVTPVPAEANPNLDCALAGLTQLTSVATIASFN